MVTDPLLILVPRHHWHESNLFVDTNETLLQASNGILSV